MTEDVKVATAQVVAQTAETIANTADKLSVAKSTQVELHSAGQRQTNLIWERTQSVIALAIVLTTCGGIVALSSLRFWHEDLGIDKFPTFPPEWWTILGLVIGFYFGRTRNDLGVAVK
jgi:hypothetical protein